MKAIPIREIKPNPSEPETLQSFRIRELKAILAGKDMHQDTHRHNFFFVLLVKKGNGKHVIDFTTYEVGDNCIYILRPGQVHQLELSAVSRGYLMEFSLGFFQMNDRGTSQILRKAAATNSCRLPEDSFTRLHSILQAIHQEYQDAHEGYHQVIRAQLDIFFILFVRNRQASKIKKDKGSPYEQGRLEEFLELVEKNLSNKKQVSEYADLLNLSPYQLSALTKSVLGKSPSEVINECVILESKRYLLATSDQVNQIAWHLGYEDPSYFIRFFKKHTGRSPDAFRTNFK